jgi:AGZA family xanthine/uracil permease-like MFS transporter
MPLAFFYGTFMRGQPGEANLAAATLIEHATTAPRYQLFSIRDEHPLMLEVGDGGAAINGQLLDVPQDVWDNLMSVEPPGLHMTKIELADGRLVDGMLGEREYAEGAGTDISAYGGWAEYRRRDERA